MTDQAARHLEDELARLRQLRNATLTMLRREGLSHEEKLHAIEPAFQEERDEGEHDEEAEAEERVAVTDRGRVIAELVPPSARRVAPLVP